MTTKNNKSYYIYLLFIFIIVEFIRYVNFHIKKMKKNPYKK